MDSSNYINNSHKAANLRMSSISIAEREFLYKTILGQLLYDGLENEALYLGNSVGLQVDKIPPSPHLLYSIRSFRALSEIKKNENKMISNFDEIDIYSHYKGACSMKSGLDFDGDFESISSPSISEYECQYNASHKNPCTVAAFSPDGRLLASGSQDTSLKILEVEKIYSKTNESKNDKNSTKGTNDEGGQQKNHPVVRTLYDHTSTVTCLEFHPSSVILVSGGSDRMINFFDYSKPTAKKAFKTIMETETINNLSFHPTGDYLLVAVEHPTIRLYDVNTQSCFVTSNPGDQHTASVSHVKYNFNGKMYSSSSCDGSFKLWDGVSNKCINSFQSAHNGLEVVSSIFTASGNHVLSASIDGVCRLWDIRTASVIQTYTGATDFNCGRAPAVFNQNEDYVIYLYDKSTIGCWNSRTGEKLSKLSSTPASIVTWIMHSPTEPALASCWEDNKLRFSHFGSSH